MIEANHASASSEHGTGTGAAPLEKRRARRVSLMRAAAFVASAILRSLRWGQTFFAHSKGDTTVRADDRARTVILVVGLAPLFFGSMPISAAAEGPAGAEIGLAQGQARPD